MSAPDVDIGRLTVAVHGVSALVAEQALAGLEDELRRRLGSLHGSWETAAIPALRVGPLDLPPGANAAALRHLVAERLLQAVLKSAGSDPAEGE